MNSLISIFDRLVLEGKLNPNDKNAFFQGAMAYLDVIQNNVVPSTVLKNPLPLIDEMERLYLEEIKPVIN